MNSQVMRTLYQDWAATASPEDVEFVDNIFAEAEDHYDDGGDTVVECFDPPDILRTFRDGEHCDILNIDIPPMTLREYCGLKVEQALNTRWGEDDDPEVKRAERFENNWGPDDDRDPNNPAEYSGDYDWSEHDFDNDPDWGP